MNVFESRIPVFHPVCSLPIRSVFEDKDAWVKNNKIVIKSTAFPIPHYLIAEGPRLVLAPPTIDLSTPTVPNHLLVLHGARYGHREDFLYSFFSCTCLLCSTIILSRSVAEDGGVVDRVMDLIDSMKAL